jgi:SAM-dependent methyltransferase
VTNKRLSLLEYNWLVNNIHNKVLSTSIKKYAKGILLDIGCGQKPYETMVKGYVNHHIGLDHLLTYHNSSNVDIFATSYNTSFANDSIDTILCTVVLEHLEKPQDAVIEMFRILKPEGYVILSTPLYWHLHEEPRDFYRYTKYGIDHLFTTAGFDIIEITPLSGFIVTFAQELVYYLNFFRRGFLKYPLLLFQVSLQVIAYLVNRWDKSHKFTWAYMVIAKKRC